MRAKKTVDGDATYYVGPHFQIHNQVEEKYIFAGGIRVAMKRGSDTYYFHKNHLGSTIAFTDQTGTVRERIEYLPFGGEAYHAGERIARYKFTDQEHDSEVNLYNYNARLYDPILRRFTAADTIVPNYKSPQTLNRYSYCYNNPLSYVDPDGHFGFLGSMVLGAIIGGVTSAAADGNIGMGILTGGISGALFFGAGEAIAAGNAAAVQSAVQAGVYATTEAAVAAGVGMSIAVSLEGRDNGKRYFRTHYEIIKGDFAESIIAFLLSFTTASNGPMSIISKRSA